MYEGGSAIGAYIRADVVLWAGKMNEKERLNRAIYDTIENADAWTSVLQLFLDISGAKKGVIVLRDRLTAEMVFPTTVARIFQSPLLNGFSKVEVDSYLNKYQDIDPWTEIEKVRHPHVPYALSDHYDHSELVRHKFWEWLKPQGIGDTVVAEIGQSGRNWVSMNLYFAAGDEDTKQAVLALVSELLWSMPYAWRVGEVVRDARRLEDRRVSFLGATPGAAFLLRSDRSIIAQNTKADILLDEHAACLSVRNGRLVFKDRELQRLSDEAFDQFGPRRRAEDTPEEHVVDTPTLRITFIALGAREDFLGSDVATRLVTFVDRSAITDASLQPIWEHPDLTTKERLLARSLAEGLTIIQHANKMKIGRDGANFHWRNLKEKLGVTKTRDIYARHEAYLAKTYTES